MAAQGFPLLPQASTLLQGVSAPAANAGDAAGNLQREVMDAMVAQLQQSQQQLQQSQQRLQQAQQQGYAGRAQTASVKLERQQPEPAQPAAAQASSPPPSAAAAEAAGGGRGSPLGTSSSQNCAAPSPGPPPPAKTQPTAPAAPDQEPAAEPSQEAKQ